MVFILSNVDLPVSVTSHLKELTTRILKKTSMVLRVIAELVWPLLRSLTTRTSVAESNPTGLKLSPETIIFMCMGAVKSLDGQEVILEQIAINIGRANQALKDVEVFSALNHTTLSMPKLSCLIKSNYEESWGRLGYIVQVALGSKHQALANITVV